jgi:hypothetical protein
MNSAQHPNLSTVAVQGGNPLWLSVAPIMEICEFCSGSSLASQRERETTSAMLAVPAIDTSKSAEKPYRKTRDTYLLCSSRSDYFLNVDGSIPNIIVLSNFLQLQ